MDKAIQNCDEALSIPLFRDGQRRRLEQAKRQIESSIAPQEGGVERNAEIEELDLVDEYKCAKERKNASESWAMQEATVEQLKDQYKFGDGLKGQEEFFGYMFFSLFFDQIYSSTVPGVFRFHFQKYPLDLETSAFIEHRRPLFNHRFAELQGKNPKEIYEIIKDQRKRHPSLKQATKMNSITSDHVKHLLICIGKERLFACLRRLSESYFTCKEGPNLILYNFNEWKPAENAVRFVECYDARKEPNEERMLWVEFLNSINLPAQLISVKIAE